MRKASLIVIFILINIFIYSLTSLQYNQNYQKLINILNSLDVFMNANAGAGSYDELFKKYRYVKFKIMDRVIYIIINYEYKESVFGTAGYSPENFNDSKHNLIIINAYLLDLYDKHPSAVFSILIHEYIHAYNYLNDIYISDKTKFPDISYCLNEIEASVWEAFFIKNYLYPRGYRLSNFENHLMENINNIESLIPIFYGFECPVILKLYEIKTKEGQSAEERLNELLYLGKDIISNEILPNDTDENKFRKIIGHVTYEKYSGEVIEYLKKTYDLENNNKYLTKIRAVISEMKTVLTVKNISFREKFCNDFRSKYDN